MKLVEGDFVRDGPGYTHLVPEVEDDLWDAYNLIAKGNTVEAITIRKVVDVRVKLQLQVTVEHAEYDKEGCTLRVRGTNNIRKIEDVIKIGQFHTLELGLNRPFILPLPRVRKEAWDWPVLNTIKQACDAATSTDLAIVLMQEGLAHLHLVGRSVTATVAKIETPIPRKHAAAAVSTYEPALRGFFEQVLQALLKHIDFGLVKCVVIVSPGFTKDQFRDYMLLQAAARQPELRAITENKARIVVASAPLGYKHSLKDVLGAPSLLSLIKDTKAAQEVPVLKEFYAMITNDSDRACYGPKHVELANDRLAIQTLLLTDSLFRNTDVATRHKYVGLVTWWIRSSVKKFGRTVHIFSSMHVSGDQLAQMTGVAAILRFPLPELDEIEM